MLVLNCLLIYYSEYHFPCQFTRVNAILILVEEIIPICQILSTWSTLHLTRLRKDFLMTTVLPNHQNISNWGHCRRLMNTLKSYKSWSIQIYQLVIVEMVWVSTKKLQESHMIYMDFQLQVWPPDFKSKSIYQLHFREYMQSIVDLIC